MQFNRWVVALAVGAASCSAPMRGAMTLATCEGLARTAIDHAEITAAQSLPAGAFTPAGNFVDVAVPFCRVALTLRPSVDSVIKTEVWMPASSWNGKFQGIGNGGFAGSIEYGAMAQAVAQGYATAATDTGHAADGMDAAWALGHPEKIKDFGYRAVHETALAAKSLVSAFYSAAPKRSYFNSCSNGGRQALMEAQRFPDDYDGIIAGAPANAWTRLMSTAIVNLQTLLTDAASYVPAAKLSAISAAALSACDANDGVKDGVIENPAACKFDPAVLQCSGAENNRCLTPPQVTALKKLYAPTVSRTGERVMAGYSPGGEAEPGGWDNWITGPAPRRSTMYAFGTQFFMHMVFDNPAWDFKTFSLDRDRQVALTKVGRDLDAESVDLQAFRARGAKLILYHGWSDAAIPAESTIDYFTSVSAAGAGEDTRSFVRLFMVPGMQHCAGGSGATVFGQNGVSSGEPDRNIGAALERWVEQGVAPDRLIASKLSGTTVVRTRPLCPYPATAHYQGSGSTDDAANFVCR